LDLKEQGASLDFLGYTFRYERSWYGREGLYLTPQPSAKALARERQKLREMTSPQMCFKPIRVMIQEVNRHLRGWSNYFGWGYPHKAYREINAQMKALPGSDGRGVLIQGMIKGGMEVIIEDISNKKGTTKSSGSPPFMGPPRR
jgi:hypothetical protein